MLRAGFVFLLAGLLGSVPALGEPAAKKLFGRMKGPAPLAARAIGSYARGCLAGGTRLAANGPAWQAMRLHRNRNWGHPALVALLEKLAVDAVEKDGWPGLLVGDLAQPRGGPMITGHRSHQIGLDADIWLRPMPKGRFSLKEQKGANISAISMLDKTKLAVDKRKWKPGHVRLLKRAASYPEVARIFVHPAIKKAVCEAAGSDRGWLRKIRPWYGHHYHFHVRLKCPRGVAGCRNQKPPPAGDGCGKPLDDWFKILTRPKRPPKKGAKPPKPRRQLRLADLPDACRGVLNAGVAVAVSKRTVKPALASILPLPKPLASMRRRARKAPQPMLPAPKPVRSGITAH